MAKGSSARKVSRVASTGGGRTARGRVPWVWYGVLTLIAVLGIVGVVFSRDQRLDEISAGGGDPPRAQNGNEPGDHWHASIEFYVCDKALPVITDQRDPQGIHGHGDGVIHIHPFTRKAAGSNATLGKYAEAVGAEFDDDSFEMPDGEKYENGEKCGDKAAEVKYQVNGELYEGDPDDLLLKDNQLITVAFVPEGTKIPDAPADRLETLNDVPGASTTVPAGGASTTTPPGGETSATTAPAESTETSAPGETSSTGETPETTATPTP